MVCGRIGWVRRDCVRAVIQRALGLIECGRIGWVRRECFRAVIQRAL